MRPLIFGDPENDLRLKIYLGLWAVFVVAFLVSSCAASAQDYVMPQIPTEAEKVEALKQAYRLNGNSMVGYNMMVDLTDPALQKADRIVKTVPVKPEAPPPEAAKPVEKRAEVQDTCRRHGLRKIVTGSSWRCRK